MNEIVILALVLLFAYPLFMRIMLERVKPIRDRMAELGNELLASPDYNDKQKALICAMLDDAYEWRFMIAATVNFPRMVWDFVVGKGLRQKDEIEVLGRDQRFREFVDLHMRSTMAANPLFAVVFRLEIAFVLLFVASLVIVPLLVLATVANVAPRVSGTKRLNHV